MYEELAGPWCWQYGHLGPASFCAQSPRQISCQGLDQKPAIAFQLLLAAGLVFSARTMSMRRAAARGTTVRRSLLNK